MNKERNISIDIIKGIGIILMVGGHCGMPFTHFIYLFHMAIFFMASGYCFNASNSETMQDVLSFVKRKFKGLRMMGSQKKGRHLRTFRKTVFINTGSLWKI